jgi:hypothetical protein
MWSMWNAPSDRDYYDPFGADCDKDEPEICGDCGARWDRGEACEEWCATNHPEPVPVPIRLDPTVMRRQNLRKYLLHR